MPDDLTYYVTGPNFAGSLTLTKHNGKWAIRCPPYLREVIGDVAVREIRGVLEKAGFRVERMDENGE